MIIIIIIGTWTPWRCFNYRGRETDSLVGEKERSSWWRERGGEKKRGEEGIRKREMTVASFLAKIISSRKESAPRESGAVPWLLRSPIFFSFLFQRGETSRETPFPFNRVFNAQRESFSRENVGTRGSRVEFNLSFFRRNNRFEIISISRQISFPYTRRGEECILSLRSKGER